MTAAPDPAEIAPTRNAAAYHRRTLFTGGFWVMMAFCALCLLAAVAVVVMVPRLKPARRAVDAATAQLAAPPAPPPATPVFAAPPPASAGAASSPDVAALDGRVQRLEGDESRVTDAAAAALAAASLSDAAARPGPFGAELTAAARLLPASPDALALAPLAQQGAPTRQALAADLTNLGAKVSSAARAPGQHASFVDWALYAFSRVVTVRRIDTTSSGPDAILARAELAADDGDLERAVAVTDTLPDNAKTALADWRERAWRRIEIDRLIAGLRSEAMAALAQAKSAPA